MKPEAPVLSKPEEDLALIGEGLQEKGRTWRVIQSPSSAGTQLILRTSLQHITPAMWN